ncbi:hypothetical protein F5Y15DRAFT_363123 [Xylariaceae sp. FL0016]|nr:hypothetical protein F5Y15DRAFT_363123 [Xylariaceae sp. FL0016]
METSSRRKACDLCFKKKIRCDGLKPTCSNCRLYNVECGTTTMRRRTGTDPKPGGTPLTSNDDTGDKEDLVARLARIEAKLDDLRSSRGEGGDESGLGLDISLEREFFPTPDIKARDSLTDFSPESSSWVGSKQRDEPHLPPITEVLPIVELYFREYNSAIPLFDQHSFTRMMNEFYSGSSQKSRAVAAAISIVLAFGYRVQAAADDYGRDKFSDMKAKRCVDNAQMTLDELMVREEDMLGIQVLLGLVIILQTHPDQKPPAILLSAAMRLAHRLRLDSKTNASEMTPDQQRQKCNVFWICYWLDKDVSLRSITPSIQHDADIEWNLPGSDTTENYQLITSLDGLWSLRYFRTRVQLAHIEGRIFDSLYSNRSKRHSAGIRQQAVTNLDRLLRQWRQSIPEPLRLENMTGTLTRSALLHMTCLYQTYFICLVMIHGLYSTKSPWLRSLHGVEDYLVNISDHQGWGLENQTPTLPQAWNGCVSTSRSCLKIFSYYTFGSCSVWLSSCVHFSAIVLLLANLTYFPEHDLAEHDRHLAKASIMQMEKYFAHKDLETLTHLRVLLTGLAHQTDMSSKASERAGPWQLPEQRIPFDYNSVFSVSSEIFDPSFKSHLMTDYQPINPELVWIDPPAADMLDVDFTNFMMPDSSASHQFTGDIGEL